MNVRTTTNSDAPGAFRPLPGYWNRMGLYFREMYPLPARSLTAVLLYFSFTLLVAQVQGRSPLFAYDWLLIGGLGGGLLALILRLMDELKDRVIDRDLFPGRPVPSGRVRVSDIRTSLAGACALFLVLHLGSGVAFLSAALLLTYALLMYKYFFLPPRLKSKLLVNLATHNPIVALLLAHFIVLFAVQYDVPFRDLRPALLGLIVLYWALLLAWELSRKIRYPAEETSYQTYSRVFGSSGAVLVAVLVQTFAVIAALYFWLAGELSVVYPAIVFAAYLLTLRSHVLFIAGRMGSGVHLKAAAERFAAWVMMAALAEMLLRRVAGHALS